MSALPSRMKTKQRWLQLGLLALLLLLLAVVRATLAWDRGWYVSINWTESLPFWAFVVDKRAEPKVGDYIDFWPPNNPYYDDIAFVKQVVAGPGDLVTCEGRRFFLEGREIALAKEVSQAGDILHLGPCGVVPDGHYFVLTPHKDSFDSRYQEIGYVPRDRIRGVARPLF